MKPSDLLVLADHSLASADHTIQQAKEKQGKARNPCPACRAHDSSVIRVRLRNDGTVVRRHQCICGVRFTTEQKVRVAA